LDSVQNAVDQGRYIAARLMGRAGPYADLPWFWSEQAGNRLQIAGITANHDDVVIVGEPERSAFSVLCFRGGRLIGVESITRPADHMAARKLLASGKIMMRPDAEQPGFNLRDWAAKPTQ
jgi:3-phenylpropionate/trans-cinnamate dioxygenase ferredoxin reductase subunit